MSLGQIRIGGLDYHGEVGLIRGDLGGVDGDSLAIGPAIVEDMYRYVLSSQSTDYTSALIMYVLPQFEGLAEKDAKDFIKETVALSFVKNGENLSRFAADFFGIDQQKF